MITALLAAAVLQGAGLAGPAAGEDAVDAAYRFYLDEPGRVWTDDAEFVEAVYGYNFVGASPAESIVFEYDKTGDRNADTAAALKLRSLLKPGDVIVSVLTNGYFARVYAGDVLGLDRPKVLGPIPGDGRLWEGDCANLLFNYDWEEFALATGEKSGRSFRLVRPVLSPKCRLADGRHHPEGRLAPIADERVRGVLEVALAYYLKNTAAQYCYYKFCEPRLIPEDPLDFSWTRISRAMPPEEATEDRTFFSACSTFAMEVYFEATGHWVYRKEPGSLYSYLNMPEDMVAYRYDGRSDTRPVAEVLKEIRAVLRPGDVITCVNLPSNGHTVMYIGEIDGHPKALHSTGRNYDGFPRFLVDRTVEFRPRGGKEVFELDGDICCDDLEALMFIPGHYEYLGNYRQILVWRPLQRAALALTERTKARLAYPRLRYDRRVEGGLFGGVVSGGELGYSVMLRNYSDGEYTVPVRETLPFGTSLVSANGDCRVDGGALSWQVRLSPREKKTLSWRVKVEMPAGSTVVSGGGSAGGIESNTLRTQVLAREPSFEDSLAWAERVFSVTGGPTSVSAALAGGGDCPRGRIPDWYGGYRNTEGGPGTRTREVRERDLMIGDVVYSVKDREHPEAFRVWIKGPDGFVEKTAEGMKPVPAEDFAALLSNDRFVGYRPSSEDPAAPRFDRTKLLIATYLGEPHPGDTLAPNEEQVRDMKAAGIDLVCGRAGKVDLDLFAKYGIGVFLSSENLWWWGGYTNEDGSSRNGRMPEYNPLPAYTEEIAKTKDSPALYAVDVGDEPSALDFEYLGKVVEKVVRESPCHFAYLNLFPCYASAASLSLEQAKSQLGTPSYEEHIAQYVKYVPLDYICFDSYIWGWGNKPWVLYENLRVTGDACLRTDKSLWVILQANEFWEDGRSNGTGAMTVNRLRYQSNVALAFGAEMISWACWHRGWWTNNVLDMEGKKTFMYDRVRQVNAELHTIGDRLMKFRRVKTDFVGFGDSPDEIGRAKLTAVAASDCGPVKGIRAADGKALLVGHFVRRDGSAERAFFAVACDDPHDRDCRTRKVVFEAPGLEVRVENAAGAVAVTREGDVCSFELKSSEAVLVTVRRPL